MAFEKMKIGFYYNSTLLGYLEKTKNGFAYTSNIPNEKMLIKKRFLIYGDNSYRLLNSFSYQLWNSFKREKRMLFPEFEDLLITISRRADIMKRAKIEPTDSRWEKLVKLSALKFYPSGFYVQQVDLSSSSNS